MSFINQELELPGEDKGEGAHEVNHSHHVCVEVHGEGPKSLLECNQLVVHRLTAFLKEMENV